MPNFWSPPRGAPGFIAGCSDAGDMLASKTGRDVTILVVTTALRTAVESTGDPGRGLTKIRAALAVAGSRLPTPWRTGYYGKDLVTMLPGRHPGRVLEAAAAEAALTDWPSPYGWAWTWVGAPTLSARLEGAYRASVAARVRRDHPHLRASEATSVLEEWRADRVAPPAPCEVASMLAAVLVRPYGTADAPVSGPGEDPRWPGVRSADGLNSAILRAINKRSFGGLYIITDVHDIEWANGCEDHGSQSFGEDEKFGGNAARLLPWAQAWLACRASTDETLTVSYRDRLAREQLLAIHLRALTAQHGELFGTLGDGVEGIVESQTELLHAITSANACPRHLRSGVGAAWISNHVGMFENQNGETNTENSQYNLVHAFRAYDDARDHALFSLHVTKTLKYSGSPSGNLHVYGTALTSRDEITALSFLQELNYSNRRKSQHHHLRHAKAHSANWGRHLSREAYSAFQLIIRNRLSIP
jgi:hypothetical protein